MVVVWMVISSLAGVGILLSCLVEMVREMTEEMVVEMVGGVVIEIGEGGMKFFTLCRLPICFHQVSEQKTFFSQGSNNIRLEEMTGTKINTS